MPFEGRAVAQAQSQANSAKPPRLDVVLLHVFLAGDMLLASRFFEFVGFFVRSPLFYLTVACLPYFFIRAVQRSYLPEITIFALAALGMLAQNFHFAAISRQPLNFNSIAQFNAVFCFVVFANFVRARDVDYLLRAIYLYSCVYVVVYVAASTSIFLHLMPGDIEARLTESDPERGARILIVASATLYCVYFSYFKLVETRAWRYAAMLAFALTGLIMSQSRLLLVIVGFVQILSPVLPGRRGLSIVCFGGFLALSGVILYGMYDPHWNPFVIFGDDTSARIRTGAYDTVRQILWAHPLAGAGIAASDADMVAFTSNPTLSAADLGPIGIWLVFGLVGVVVYVISVYMQCFCTQFGGCGSVSNSKAVQYTGCIIGFFGCLTPTWFNGSLFGLFMALYLRRSTILHDAAERAAGGPAGPAVAPSHAPRWSRA